MPLRYFRDDITHVRPRRSFELGAPYRRAVAVVAAHAAIPLSCAVPLPDIRAFTLIVGAKFRDRLSYVSRKSLIITTNHTIRMSFAHTVHCPYYVNCQVSTTLNSDSSRTRLGENRGRAINTVSRALLFSRAQSRLCLPKCSRSCVVAYVAVNIDREQEK